MKKDRFICFRSTSELHESLSKVAKEDRRSLSLTIEIALTQFLLERKALSSLKEERRQYPRKVMSVPAFINRFGGSGKSQLYAASVINISLGGVKVSLPKNIGVGIFGNPDGARFQIIFSLPNGNMPISIDCETRSVVDSAESVYIGASFADADFNSYKSLQSYLM